MKQLISDFERWQSTAENIVNWKAEYSRDITLVRESTLNIQQVRAFNGLKAILGKSLSWISSSTMNKTVIQNSLFYLPTFYHRNRRSDTILTTQLVSGLKL